MSDTQNRLCPVCGTVTDLSHCPKDGTGTIGAVAFTKHPRNYEAGDIVGERYRITGELGAGGFAAVFAAEHTGTHQAVAVKLLALDPSEESARVTVRRFFREAQVTAQLSSPHTVRIQRRPSHCPVRRSGSFRKWQQNTRSGSLMVRWSNC